MAYLISDLRNDLDAIGHGTTTDKVTNFYNLVWRAASSVLLEVDPQETKKLGTAFAIYDSVYDYSAPADLKGKKVIDIRPQVRRTSGIVFNQEYSQEFDRDKDDLSFTVEYLNGTKFLRISRQGSAGSVLNECETATANGTWAVGSNATNLLTDDIDYVTGGSSLKFDVSASGTTAYLENSTMTDVDLTDYRLVSAAFVWVYIPDSSIITNFILRWGNDTSNYWSKTVTAPQFGSFKNGWNLLKFDWSTATETGTVDETAVDYARLTVTYTGSGATTGYRMDSITFRIGTLHEAVYYSNYLFQTTGGGSYKEAPSAETDVILLDTESRNLLVFKTAEYMAQQVAGEDSASDAKYFSEQYKEAKKNYVNDVKNESSRPQTVYYNMNLGRRTM